MTEQKRMSPLTALFLGFFGVGGLLVVSVATIAIFALSIVDRNVSTVISLAENTVDDLPALLETLPDSVQKLFNDEPYLAYASQIDVDVDLVAGADGERIFPALVIRNQGDREVSMLTVRVAALNRDGVPVNEWTEVVATPIGIEDEFRGPLAPGSTRYVRMHSWWSGRGYDVDTLKGVPEVSDVRVRLSPRGTSASKTALID